MVSWFFNLLCDIVLQCQSFLTLFCAALLLNSTLLPCSYHVCVHSLLIQKSNVLHIKENLHNRTTLPGMHCNVIAS